MVSPDGHRVAFVAVDLAPDTSGNRDIYVHNLRSGRTKLASVSSSGILPNERCFSPSLSDGHLVAFQSRATNLVASDTNGFLFDIFIHNLHTGTTKLVSLSSMGAQGNKQSLSPSISSDGSRVAFESLPANLVTGDTNGTSDIFVRG
jgi:Tol biopolymer transport system component